MFLVKQWNAFVVVAVEHAVPVVAVWGQVSEKSQNRGPNWPINTESIIKQVISQN